MKPADTDLSTCVVSLTLLGLDVSGAVLEDLTAYLEPSFAQFFTYALMAAVAAGNL